MSAKALIAGDGTTMSPEKAHLRSHKPGSETKAEVEHGEIPLYLDGCELPTDNHLPNGTVFSATAPALPLTPPSLLLDSKQQSPPTLVIDSSQLQSANGTANTTPTRHSNVLTPDMTPPRTALQGLKRPAQHRNFPSMSSRADSFKTACEVFSSDDETMNTPEAAVLHPSRLLQSRLPRSYQGVSEIDHQTASSSTESTPKARKEKMLPNSDQLGLLDGQRSGNGTGSIRIPKVRAKREYRCVGKSDEAPLQTEEVGSGLIRGRSLRGRGKEFKNATNEPTTEKSEKNMGCFLEEDRDRHSCRLSGVSASSTIEAYIIDSPPRKKPTLRHVEKAESLRSISSHIPYSNRDTSVSGTSDQRGRLVRKSARITNRDRWSIASDTLSLLSTTTYLRPKPPKDIIPVVIVPQRRSSLSFSSCGSREHSQTRSMIESRRPTTAPNGGSAFQSYDLPKRRRTVSEALPYSRNSGDTTRRISTSRPMIPKRRSSLSAPTSRNPSRTASLTSDNLQRYQAAQDAEYARSEHTQGVVQEDTKATGSITAKTERPVSNNLTAQDSNQNRFSAEAHCNDSLLQPPSLPKTPFQSSIQSLSPGPIEISEARAVPFFAHNNKSLLVVEQYPQAESRAVQRLRTSLTDLEVTLAAPHTPIMNSQAKASLDSPLRNPRPPPRPPVLKVTPPTPFEVNNKLPSSSTESSNGLVRRWDSLRRTFNSSRRGPGAREPGSIHRFRNRKAGKEIDSELHPFWRPRGFWEDFGDWDIDGEPVQQRPTPVNTRESGDVYIGNSLGIPQKRIFQGPLKLLRRVSNRNRLRAPRRRNASHTSVISATLSLSGRQGGNHMLSHFLSFREMQAWIARTRRRREREKLEAKRNRLRHMIGERVTVDPNSVASKYHPPPTASAFDS